LGCQEVLQPTEQRFLLVTSGHDRQAALWPTGSEVFKEPAVMQTIAGKFSGEEIAALAAYFGSLKPKN